MIVMFSITEGSELIEIAMIPTRQTMTLRNPKIGVRFRFMVMVWFLLLLE